MPPIVNPYARKRQRPPETGSADGPSPAEVPSVAQQQPVNNVNAKCHQIMGGRPSAEVLVSDFGSAGAKSDVQTYPSTNGVHHTTNQAFANKTRPDKCSTNRNKNAANPYPYDINSRTSSLKSTSSSNVNEQASFEGDDIDWDQVARSADQVSKEREEKVNTPKKKQATADSPLAWRQTNSGSTSGSSLKRAPSAGIPPSHPPSATPAPAARGDNKCVAKTLEPVQLDRPNRWQNVGPGSLAPPSRSSSLNSGSSSFEHDRIPSVLQISSPTKPVQDKHRQSLVQHANLSSPLLNGWTLFSHQKKAILRALLMRRFILALDCGLGKTLIGCVWAKAFRETFDDLHIVLICPVSMKEDWTRTAREATGLSLAQAKKGKDDNDDAVDGFIYSWAKVPTHVAATPYVVICDEAHCMQSLEATRTKHTLELVKNERKCIGVLLLTGTPMKNGKPSNLFPLLKAVKHPFGKHKNAYEAHFCEGKEKSYGRRSVWDANGASNLPQLRNMVASHLLHMTKDDCLKDLPPRTRVVRQVPISAQHQLKHNHAWQDLARLYGASEKLQDWSEAVLVAVSRVRQIGSFAKVDATVALAKEILKEEPAVVIFTSFAAVAKLVHSRLVEGEWDAELLTGETPPKKRQGMVDKFQEGLSPIFVSTFGAGGVGLTLTAAHSIILLDRPWTPGDALQAEDRVRRIGQTKPVTSIWMVAFDLDKQIDSVLESKQSASDTVLAGEGEGNCEGDCLGPAKISIFSLLKSVLHTK